MKGWVIRYKPVAAFPDLCAWVGHKGVLTFDRHKRHIWHYKKDAVVAAKLMSTSVEVLRA